MKAIWLAPSFLSLALLARPALAEEDLQFDLQGYYRVRGSVFPDLFEDQEAVGRIMQHRLRARPVVSYEDDIRFLMEFEALEDVVWGDNASLASTSLFAGDPSLTGLDGQEVSSFRVSRVWMEFPVAVGQVRIGRQPSQWGMGLLANAGDGFDDTFGENHAGATYDRVIFATRPISIVQAVMGKEDKEIPFYLAFGVDRLVEDPLFQYYGFACTPGIAEGEEDWDSRCDSDGDGVSDLDHDFADDSRSAASRGDDWWTEADDDVFEFIYVATFKGDEIELAGTTGELNTGLYAVHRRQAETGSNVLIMDYYLKTLFYGVGAEFEGLTIQGKTSAITLPGAYDPYGELEDPLAKQAAIWGYVGRLSYQQPLWEVWMEHGFASGDDYVADENFTGRPLHPDFNVGLLLYEEILARTTAATWSASADGLWSKGGVYNSRYIFPNVRVHPVEGLDIIAAWLMAWPHRPDGARILCAQGDAVECSEYKATASSLGWEADLAIKYAWREHLLFSLEGGYSSVTDRVPLSKADLNPDGKFFTLQSRMAYAF